MPVEIAASILSADFANLQSELERIRNADWVHMDVMDNHFVPNLTLGLPVAQRIVQVSPIPVDAHLMIQAPDRWAPAYAEAGATSVTFHVEAAKAPVRLARVLRNLGAQVGVALNPATPVAALENLIDEVDLVLVMSVEPGFGGQSFIEQTLTKLAQTRQLIGSRQVKIQVDGGVSRQTIARIAQAGADLVVAGTAIFGAANPAQEVEALRELCR